MCAATNPPKASLIAQRILLLHDLGAFDAAIDVFEDYGESQDSSVAPLIRLRLVQVLDLCCLKIGRRSTRLLNVDVDSVPEALRTKMESAFQVEKDTVSGYG